MNKPNQKNIIVAVSEPEIQMIIQSLINDTGSVDAAQKLVYRKISEIHHDILTQGLNEFNESSRDEWLIVQRYFQRRRGDIVRAQNTINKFWPH